MSQWTQQPKLMFKVLGGQLVNGPERGLIMNSGMFVSLAVLPIRHVAP
jgi:hypothetical protein